MQLSSLIIPRGIDPLLAGGRRDLSPSEILLRRNLDFFYCFPRMPTPLGARREAEIPTCDGVLTQSAAADRAPLHDQRLISYHGRALSLDVVLIFMSFKISCSALSAFVQGLEYTLRIPKTLLPSLDSVRIPQLELIAPKSVYVALSPSWMFLWSVLQKYCS